MAVLHGCTPCLQIASVFIKRENSQADMKTFYIFDYAKIYSGIAKYMQNMCNNIN